MKALVIDDDRDHRETVAGILRASGWIVDVAEDGVGVLELLRSTPHGRAIPVVLVTGADVADPVRALADAVLMKPFDPAALLRVAGRLAGGARRAGARRA